ncbi:MAG: F0F1 ATP synthase subunit B [Hyphomicrobiales bacterium]
MAEEVHTETQVAHGEGAHSGGFPPFDSSTFGSQLLWLAITFGLLYYLMAKVALPRIAGILEDRRDRIEGDREEALRLKEETDAAIAAYEQALAEARAKAHGIAQATRDKLSAEVAEKRTAVEAELAGKLAEAETRIREIKATALGQVGEIAADATGEIVRALGGGDVAASEVTDAVNQSLGK